MVRAFTHDAMGHQINPSWGGGGGGGGGEEETL